MYNAIEIGLINESARQNLPTDLGITINWNTLKRMYPNIEEGLVDQIKDHRINSAKARLTDIATASQEEFDNAINTLVTPKKYSARNPMSYTEYLIWQDAVAVFIENMILYIPAPLPKEYRGLSKYRILGYFCTYLNEKCRLEFGKYPYCVINTIGTCYEEYIQLGEKYPYIYDFMNTYCDYGAYERAYGRVVNWNSENLARFSSKFGSCFHNDSDKFNRLVSFEFQCSRKDKDYKIKVYRNYPTYIIEDGKIGFWKETYGSYQSGNTLIEEYFENFPEEKDEYDAKITAHKQSVLEESNLERELDTAKRAIENIKASISDKNATIEVLKKKIFGKKKAMVEIEVLNNEISSANDKIQALTDEIADIESKINSIVSDWDFYENLVDEMNGFLVITWVVEQ